MIKTPVGVGPGAYNTQSMIDRRIMNPFFAREGLEKSGKSFSRNTSATIKADYEAEEEDEVKHSPGPGSYTTDVSSFRVKKNRPGSL